MALDTIANVKTRLGITDSANDAFLTNQVDIVSDAIEAYCRRVFTEQDVIQTFYKEDYEPTKRFELFHFPVSEITTIVEDDGDPIDDSLYVLNKGTGIITRRDQNYFFFADTTVITYTCGYDPIPNLILSVLDNVVQERYNKKVSGVELNFGSDVQRISIPGTISIDFDYTLTNNDRTAAFGTILGNNLNVLDQFRSERAIVGQSKLIYLEEAP